MSVPDFSGLGEELNTTFPAIFIGHGSPMNAIEENEFSLGWQELAGQLPKPEAVICISAHWETNGSMVTAMDKPRTIHDFGGFPGELYKVQYPAPGSPLLAKEIINKITQTEVTPDYSWGIDHGCWSVLRRMYPEADVPVIQLSLDVNKNPLDHYNLGKELAILRKKNVMILGSGNMVHNLGRMVIKGDFNEPFGLDWALEANDLFKKLIAEDRMGELINYESLGNAVRLAVPTPEHYLPMLYTLALKREGKDVQYFNDKPVAGSLTMTSFIIQ
jgi:4,5-DOPA dioxygenase extradiol